jgi:hypothetical protein
MGFELIAGNELNSFHVDRLRQVDANFDCQGIGNIGERLCFQAENEQVQIILFANAPGIAYRRVVAAGEVPMHVRAVKETLEFAADSPFFPSPETFCFHAENTRMYENFTTSVLTDRTRPINSEVEAFEPVSGTRWSGEGNLRREIGRSPFQPFPVMIYGNRNSERILLDGTLTQKRFYRYYDVAGNGYGWYQAPKTIKAVAIDPGQQFIGEWNYVEVGESRDLHHPYAGYLAALKNFGVCYQGTTSCNRHTMVWGSWNDGIFRDIDQESILKTADFLQEHFPTVKWLQIDDGYDEWDYETNDRVGIGVAYPGETISRKKFPQGIKHFVSEIKARGLRPAIWVGLNVATTRRPYLEKPEWFVVYQQAPMFAFYDISRSDVREFIRNAFRTFTQEWGFEGIKLDFWSYFFEDEQIVLPTGKITGGEYRNWFLKTCREFLPEDGYLQTGCDIAMANPHLAEYVDNYRYGIDIGQGAWGNVKTNAKWAAFCLNTHTGDIFLPNSDSIGYFPGLAKEEAQTAINFCLVTRTLMEISGWLYRQPNNPLLPTLKKACSCPKNGEDVFFGDFNFKETDAPPAVWYLKSPHFSLDGDNPCLPLRTAGVFNWDDQPRNFSLNAASFGLESAKGYLLADFWSDDVLVLPAGKTLELSIAPHHSRLFSISRLGDARAILDSTIQLNAVEFSNGILRFDVPFPGPAEILLAARPERIYVGDQPVEFSSDLVGTYCKVKCEIPELTQVVAKTPAFLSETRT